MPTADDKAAQIFLSYCWTDNGFPVRLTPEGKEQREGEWVSRFRSNLEQQLRAFKGYRPDEPDLIWQDVGNVRGIGDINDQVANYLDRVVLFCAILSPSFLASDWCMQEVDYFTSRMLRDRGNPVTGFFMKIVRRPLQGRALPKVFAGSRGAVFHLEGADKTPRELAIGSPEFEDRLTGVAYQLFQTLQEIEDQAPAAGIVYFCAACGDTDGVYASLINELVDHRYQVITSISELQPGRADECREMIRAEMAKASMIVHLVGDFAPVMEPAILPDIEAEEMTAALELCAEPAGPNLFLWRARPLTQKSVGPAWPDRPGINQVMTAEVDFRRVSTSTLEFRQLKPDLLKRLQETAAPPRTHP